MNRKLILIMCVFFGVLLSAFAGPPPEFAYLTLDQISNVTVNNSYNTTSYTPWNVVNGAGLNYLDWTHANGQNNMWMGGVDKDTNPSPVGLSPDDYSVWYSVEFEEIFNLSIMWVWNFNQYPTLLGRCLKDVWIDYSQDGTNWTRLMNGEQDYFTLAQGTGTMGLEHTDEIDFGGIAAKYLTITAKSIPDGTYGDTSWAGIAELLFGIDTDNMAELTSPEDGAVAVAPEGVELSWNAPVNGASAYDVYLSSDESALSDPATIISENQSGLSYNPANLDYGTTYYWKVVSTTPEGEFASYTRSFTTQGKAVSPSPADGSFNVELDAGEGLSWQGPVGDGVNTFHTVYFSDDINNINVENPAVEYTLGTYSELTAPATDIVTYMGGSLARAQMYYWRVDSTINGLVYQGDVWHFTTVLNNYPSQDWISFDNCDGYASNATTQEIEYGGEVFLRGPLAACNGGGLDTDTWMHIGSGVAAWMYYGGKNNTFNPAELDGVAWFEVAFDKVYELGVMWVWNFNQTTLTNRGMRNVTISYSEDGWNYTTLMNGDLDYFEFAESSGTNPAPHTNEIDFGGVSAQYVLFTPKLENGNWGGSHWGLSEVMFGISGTLAPVGVDAGADRWVRVGESLEILGSVGAPDEASVTSAWSLESSPAGSNVIIDDASSLTTNFTFDTVGDYVIRLDASYELDGEQSGTSSDFATIQVEPADYTGLLGYWDFEGNLTDKSGNSNDGLAIGDAAVVNDPERGNVLQLSGGYVAVPGADFDFSSKRSEMVITAWIKPDSGNAASSGIISKGSGAWQLSLNSSADNIIFSTPQLPGFAVNADVSGSAGWYHVMLTYDGSNLSGYVNGSLTASFPAELAFTDDGYDLYFGAVPSDLGIESFKGLMDEIRIYERILTDSELLAIKHPYDFSNDGLIEAADIIPFASGWLTEQFMNDFSELASAWGFDRADYDQFLQ
jgi:hypothetical protein